MAIGMFIFFLVMVGVFLLWYLGSCPHYWTLINRGVTKRKSDESPIGEFAVYECAHCKKMKREEVEY